MARSVRRWRLRRLAVTLPSLIPPEDARHTIGGIPEGKRSVVVELTTVTAALMLGAAPPKTSPEAVIFT